MAGRGAQVTGNTLTTILAKQGIKPISVGDQEHLQHFTSRALFLNGCTARKGLIPSCCGPQITETDRSLP